MQQQAAAVVSGGIPGPSSAGERQPSFLFRMSDMQLDDTSDQFTIGSHEHTILWPAEFGTAFTLCTLVKVRTLCRCFFD